MSIVTAERAIELIDEARWAEEEVLRIFWLRVEGPRDGMARGITRTLGDHEVFAIVVRDSSFTIPNKILSDLHQLIDSHRSDLEPIGKRRPVRLTIVVLLKQDFGRAQVSSPIVLPNWFPVRPGLDTHVFLTDLVGLKDGALLSCQEAQIDRVAEQLHRLEAALVTLLENLRLSNADHARQFLQKLLRSNDVEVDRKIHSYRQHVAGVASPRGYRPNAAAATGSLVSDVLRLFLSSTNDDLASVAKDLATRAPLDGRTIKPSYLGVSLRPRVALTVSGKNWFATIVGLYQAYQMMNASAHAGDYGHYPAALIHYSSLDLQNFLEDVTDLVTYG